MLPKILEVKKEEVSRLKKGWDSGKIEEQLAQQPPCRSLTQSITNRTRKVAIIAEVKKASPSKGVIRPDFHPVDIALAYHEAKAEGISVLTDETFFQGHLQYLTEIKGRVSTPVLRKDFIIDEIQVVQSRISGADAILLIVAALTKDQLQHLYGKATEVGLEVLIEIHSLHELEIALTCSPHLIGINNRDLHTFQTTIDTTVSCLPFIPAHIPVVSESGIFTPDDVRRVGEAGASAVLVGESLMRKEKIKEAVIQLVG
ncbi:indole-3-glycerol phosphate synthase TrpC [Microaerobacter geothermalis]|uniref:indole-3-glycerol phosphate synthase TrpC n=1 Tax=Microaerobacter geothermalis TaxID=674972 RepID=UPI001F1F0E24|nr:indole-3-glycerol phosphate synthase TrpC [Microaerobacter geothermalis]MCF6093378.1 indole-3-glycerol phosphate synthase TrpC [Microaerobacter geothermalis]